MKAYQKEETSPEQQPVAQPQPTQLVDAKDMLLLQKNLELLLKDMEMRMTTTNNKQFSDVRQEISEMKQQIKQVYWCLAALVVFAVGLGLKDWLPFLKLNP